MSSQLDLFVRKLLFTVLGVLGIALGALYAVQRDQIVENRHAIRENEREIHELERDVIELQAILRMQESNIPTAMRKK